MDGIKSCTCIAPVNIAVVKYWGKRDEHLILPVNSSLSVTLGLNELHAKTSIAASTKFTDDRLWLNGKEQSVDSRRIQNVLKEVRQKTGCTGMGDGTDVKVHICSENNFPTAAGLASSAAGYACMVYTLAKLYQVEGDLSLISRQGSGSACRSIYGGFVLWDMGERSDGLDSVARQIASPDHWPDLRILILVVSDQQKQVGSTEGMQMTVAASELMQHRMQVVPQHVQDMIRAIQDRDFPTFAKITMQESNQFHAVCLDTYPPIFYLTDTSRQIIQLVHTYNKVHGETRVAYTFDAGPNACLYLMEKDVAPFLGLVRHIFPSNMDKDHPFIRGLPVTPASLSQSDLDQYPFSTSQGAVQYVIYTKVGLGPCELPTEDSLLDVEGLPRHLAH